VLAASPQRQPGWTLVSTPGYREFGFAGWTGHIYVYHTAKTTCR
jgi:hypothetical protein